MYIETNKYQTQLTEETLNAYPDEVKEQLFDFINTVPFIKNLISSNRRSVKDMPKDETGKIIIDLENPHILENMDYFRQPAIHYLKHGCYTFLKPNSNPNSEYRKYWDKEIDYCLNGCVREDGEWITGFMYWFLNYGPMMINEIKEGSKMAIRKEAFPYFWEGIYWRFHYLHKARLNGHHAIELAKRGCAKSYGLAAIMAHNLILGELSESRKRIITVLTAYQKEYLSDSKDGTLSKFKPEINFVFSNTPFPHLLLKNSPNEMTWQMGYKDEAGREKGSLNQVMAVSAKDDSEKLRGKRGWILYEEMGSFKGLLSLYDITRKSVEDGNFTFATQYLVGTAAEDESDFSSAKTLLYNPEGYNIQEIKNVYDKTNQGKSTFGYFFPAYINRAGCYNKDGVSDVIKALLEILMFRYKMKYNSDPKSLLRAIAEDPITPAEAMIKVKAAYFPVQQLTERLLELDTKAEILNQTYVGDLVLSDGVVNFKPTADIPIRDFRKKDNSQPGAIEIFEMPETDMKGDIFRDRYIIGHDPVDNDAAESNSFSSTIVLDLFTDRIVAEFTGRKQFADDNFEIVRKLCLFYNAKVLFESNKKGIYSYFSKMNSTHLLAETPEYLREKQLIKYNALGSNKYGVNASAPINNYANGLIRDWLLKPVEIETTEENKSNVIPNLYFIKNRALLEELIDFHPELNVDRIRALGMVMLYREEKLILYQGNISSTREQGSSGLEADPFFNDNYESQIDSFSNYN